VGRAAVVAPVVGAWARPRRPWLANVDRRLNYMSWKATWVRMRALIEHAAEDHGAKAPVSVLSGP